MPNSSFQLPTFGRTRVTISEPTPDRQSSIQETAQESIDRLNEVINTQLNNNDVVGYSAIGEQPYLYNSIFTSGLSSEKKAKKSSEKSKESNPYIKSMKSEYLSLLEDIEEYKIEINKELLGKISTDIESIERSNENIKKLYQELYLKEDSVNNEIKGIKSSIQSKINQIKFDNLIVKFDEYYEVKNWTNAEKCYVNASHYAYTEQMFKSLETRAFKMASRKDEIDISNLTDLIKKYLNGSTSSTSLNNILKRLATVNLSKLDESSCIIIKDFLSSLSTSNKGKALTCILENRTYSSKLTLNII